MSDTVLASQNDDMRKQINHLLKTNSKEDLVRLCRERNLSCKGTKFDLGMQILQLSTNHQQSTTNTMSPIIIHKNEYGHYVHRDTGIVFDQTTRCAIGKEALDGTIEPLTRNDIALCTRYKFRHIFPQTLDDSDLITNAFFPDDDVISESDDDENSDG